MTSRPPPRMAPGQAGPSTRTPRAFRTTRVPRAPGERKDDAAVRIWVDGGLRESGDATVSVLDHGLTVGDGVFETLKVVQGRAFATTRHLNRLARSARGLGLPEPDLDEIARACEAVIEANPMPAARLRVTYTGGRSPL